MGANLVEKSFPVTSCSHPAGQQVRTVYYVLCGGCEKILLVSYCNYPTDCHPRCTLAPVCVQAARQNYHAQIPLEVPPNLLEAAHPRVESRASSE